MGIKIGNIDASYFKVGDTDCSIYLGDTLLYPNEQPQLKLYATYSDSTSYSAECDSSTELTSGDTRPNGYTYTAMTSVVIGDCMESIGRYAFSNCSGLTSIVMSSSVTTISGDAFFRCVGLTSIDLPSSLVSIGNSCFSNCNNLQTVTFEQGSQLSVIGNNVFYGCTGLTTIDIPSGVTDIGLWAFSGCTSLESITIEAITPPTLGVTAFNNTNNCPIYVPSESVQAYKTDNNWSTYASRIQAIPNS